MPPYSVLKREALKANSKELGILDTCPGNHSDIPGNLRKLWEFSRLCRSLPAHPEIEKQLLMQLLKDIQPRWYPLNSKRTGKKSSIVTGAVQLQFTLYDPANPSAPPQQVIAKLSSICGADSPSFDGEVAQGLERTDSGDLEAEDADETELASGTDDNRTPDTAEKKRKRRLAILKRKVKRGYEFSNGTDVAGVLFIEIQKITDLPPERNGMLAIFTPLERLLWRMIAYLQKSGYEGVAYSIRAWTIWPILHQICKCCLRGKVCKFLHLELHTNSSQSLELLSIWTLSSLLPSVARLSARVLSATISIQYMTRNSFSRFSATKRATMLDSLLSTEINSPGTTMSVP